MQDEPVIVLHNSLDGIAIMTICSGLSTAMVSTTLFRELIKASFIVYAFENLLLCLTEPVRDFQIFQTFQTFRTKRNFETATALTVAQFAFQRHTAFLPVEWSRNPTNTENSVRRVNESRLRLSVGEQF